MVRGLKHPNICEYLGACIKKSSFSLVYEYLGHGTLSDRLRGKSRRLRPRNPGRCAVADPRDVGNGSHISDAGIAASREACGDLEASDVAGRGLGEGIGGSLGHEQAMLPPLDSRAISVIVRDVAEGMQYLHEVSE